jgi:nucleotide-binding universal stress UspA family protein
MYQHILVAVGPDFSEAALSTAIAKAREDHARLTMLHVTESTPWWAGWQGDSICDMPSLLNQLALVIRRNSEKMLERADVDADWQMRTLPEDGISVGRVIAEEADRLNADLIVIGVKKHGLFGFQMNHVRNVVCRHTDREVLIAAESVVPKAPVIDLRGEALHA